MSQLNISQAVSRIFQHLEDDKVEAATMACLRMARATQDHLNTVIFLRELFPKKEEVARTLRDDTQGLSDEARAFIWKTSLERWLEIHTMDQAIMPPEDNDGEERSVLKVAAGEIESELAQWQATLVELAPPAGLHPYDAAAFHHNANDERARIRLRITALNAIKSRLKTRCLNYAIQMEKQLASQDRNQAFLWVIQNEVNNYFKDRALDVYQQLQKASNLASSDDAEDAALVLTEVRRALKGAADHLYPAKSGKVICSDGRERVLGDDQYLNRLSEYLATKTSSSTTQELATAEAALLDKFMRRLNDLASKGVHAKVRRSEARQGLVGTFMFLFTIIQGASGEQ